MPFSVYSPLEDRDIGYFFVLSNQRCLDATWINTTTLPLSLAVPTVVNTSIGSSLATVGTTWSTTWSATFDQLADDTTVTTEVSVADTSFELSKLTYRDYLCDNNNYLLHHNTSKYLVKQIVKAVPMIYIEELEDPITKFGKLTPYTLLEHLIDTYGTISDSDLDAN